MNGPGVNDGPLNEPDIWGQRGTLSRSHEESDGVELPPLAGERMAPRPLRDILGEFVSATPDERESFSLILENGQTFSSDDIAELLNRGDSPFQ